MYDSASPDLVIKMATDECYRRIEFAISPDVEDHEESHAQAARKHPVTLVAIGLLILIGAAQLPALALASAATVLMNRVNRALRADNRLNGAICYVTAPSTRQIRAGDPQLRKSTGSVAYPVSTARKPSVPGY